MNYTDKYLKYKAKYLKLKSIIDKNNKKSISMSGGALKEAKTIYLFKADWCPHCVSFKPTWENLNKELNKELKFITYDSNKDANKISEFNIKGYPTIVLTRGDEAIEYVGPRNESNIKEFIKQYN